MREFKFRGMGINREWYYGNLSVITDERAGVPEGVYISNLVGRPFAYAVRPETVGEYTGFKDLSDKEIYEGDIVDYHRYLYRRKYGVVKFGEYEQDGSGGEYNATKCLGFYVETIKVFPSLLELEFNEEPYEAEEEKTVSILEFEYEVIGNIFENPNLLEVSKA